MSAPRFYFEVIITIFKGLWFIFKITDKIHRYDTVDT